MEKTVPCLYLVPTIEFLTEFMDALKDLRGMNAAS